MAKKKLSGEAEKLAACEENVRVLINPEASLGEKADAIDALSRIFNA